MTGFFKVVAAVALAGVIALPVQAQKKDDDDRPTRSVQGVVTDKQDTILEGAVVQLKDMKTLHIRSFITRQDGKYRFHSLSPDVDYELKAEHKGAGSDSRMLSSFDTRKQAVMNLKVDR
jgi:Carboxypeptidase regulatory-like domain